MYRFGSRALRAAFGIGSLLAAGSVWAQVTNGSFEDGGGSFSGWSTSGNATIQTGALGSGPTHGTFDALLATATDGTGGVPPGLGSSGADLETFLGLSAGTLAGLGNGTPLLGSAVRQSFSVQAGERLSFDWDFLTNQTYNDGTNQSIAPSLGNNDFAFVMVRPSGGSASVAILADTFFGYVNDPNAPGGFITGFQITPASNPFISETGFLTWSMQAGQDMTMDLAVGVLHVTTGVDNGVNSAVLVDNVRIDPVPEPASLLALSGALAYGAVRRRRSRA